MTTPNTHHLMPLMLVVTSLSLGAVGATFAEGFLPRAAAQTGPALDTALLDTDAAQEGAKRAAEARLQAEAEELHANAVSRMLAEQVARDASAAEEALRRQVEEAARREAEEEARRVRANTVAAVRRSEQRLRTALAPLNVRFIETGDHTSQWDIEVSGASAAWWSVAKQVGDRDLAVDMVVMAVGVESERTVWRSRTLRLLVDGRTQAAVTTRELRGELRARVPQVVRDWVYRQL